MPAGHVCRVGETYLPSAFLADDGVNAPEEFETEWSSLFSTHRLPTF